MISPQYCQMMARYNQWQNNGLRALVKGMDEEELRKDRGAFFGSISKTMNHLLWGDIIWLHRFGQGAPPDVPADQNTELTPNKTEWDRLRFLTDGRIVEWTSTLKSIDVTGDLTWYSVLNQQEQVDPKGMCLVHFFNHQTHHRGQIHAMMTAAGQKPIATDIPFMTET